MSKSLTITFSEGRISAINGVSLSELQSSLIERFIPKDLLGAPLQEEVTKAILFKLELLKEYTEMYDENTHENFYRKIVTPVRVIGIGLPELHKILLSTFTSQIFAQAVAESFKGVSEAEAAKQARVISNKMMLALNTVLANI